MRASPDLSRNIVATEYGPLTWEVDASALSGDDVADALSADVGPQLK